MSRGYDWRTTECRMIRFIVIKSYKVKNKLWRMYYVQNQGLAPSPFQWKTLCHSDWNFSSVCTVIIVVYVCQINSWSKCSFFNFLIVQIVPICPFHISKAFCSSRDFHPRNGKEFKCSNLCITGDCNRVTIKLGLTTKDSTVLNCSCNHESIIFNSCIS